MFARSLTTAEDGNVNTRHASILDQLQDQLLDQRRLVEKLETERHSNRAKIKELSEQIVLLQKRNAESSHFGSEGEDSPDALSEIDRQQELYNNISMKNKHIKRLLRDLDDLEKRNRFQIDTINSLQVSLNDATKNLTTLTDEFEEMKAVFKEQKVKIEEANDKIQKSEERISELEEEKTRCEEDLEDFSKKLEDRTIRWKEVLGTKQSELEEIQAKYAELLDRFPGYDVEAERKEFKKMASRLHEKDELIEQLEQKITLLSQEILTSTELMNRISQEKEVASKETVKVSNCCEGSRQLLDKANKRCEELQEMLAGVEEDNMLKSRQAVEAIEALGRYESGEEGLATALKKINRLHEKVNVRDKQIRELVAEINLANEIAMENAVLRKRLGISDDEAIPTHSVLSKQRKIEKVNERLALKLRASEEMRLQLKLEKNDLKRKLFQMSQSLSSQRSSDKEKNDQVEPSAQESEANNDHADADEVDNGMLEEVEKKYAAVVEENENLRIGMHEILQKLRDYDAMSSQITIDTSTLERLLHALDARSVSGWYHPAMRLQNELLATRERELLLKERLSKQSTSLSIGSRDDSGNVCDDDTADMDQQMAIVEPTDFSEQVLLKSVEIDRLNEVIEELKNERDRLVQSNDELAVTKRMYEELLQFTRSTDDEKDRLLVETLDRLKHIESNICAYQRKIDYLKAENDNLHNAMRVIKVDHLNVLHGLKTELARKSSTLRKMESQSESVEKSGSSSELDSIERLEGEIERMKLETANFYTIFLKNIQEVDKENMIELEYDTLSRFGLVDANLAIEFIPKEEFKRTKHQLQSIEEDLKRQTTKNGHLQELLKVSQEQIRSQQTLLSKYADEEISLRHLVADLQSSSNEKYLLAKIQKELDLAVEQVEFLKLDNAKMKQSLVEATLELEKAKEQRTQQELDFIDRQKDNSLKIKFLTKSVRILHDNYNAFTPTYAVTDFVKQYANLLEQKKDFVRERFESLNRSRHEEYERLFSKLKENLEGSQIQDKINLIKFESQCEYLTKQLILAQDQVEQLQEENSNLKLKNVENTQHWDTIELIFNGEGKPTKQKDKYFDKEVQVSVEIDHKCINTIPIIDDSLAEKPRMATPPATRKTSEAAQMTDEELSDPVSAPPVTVTITSVQQRSLESQLKQAMMLASTRSALLLENESRLMACHGRIKLLEKTLEDKEEQLRREKSDRVASGGLDKLDDNILSTTIGSLQGLLLEKDTTLSRYQELLRNEREEHSKAYDEHVVQIKALKKEIDELEQKVYDKQKQTDNLQTQLRDLNEYKMQQESAAVEREVQVKKEEEIEALKVQVKAVENKLRNAEEELKKAQVLMRESVLKEKRLERVLREKEAEIVALNDKLVREHEDYKELTENVASAQEIEQLREMLEEKDRHIQDLTETLSQFHDDQQKFMNDTSLHSAEQVSQLSADLNRSEASNRVLKTQLEALKRQILSVQQREKQSRELVKTLKNQLIKRPVISMKPERTTTPREDQLARKVQQLETELLDTKDELRKQVSINENRRAKNAAELDLWNKQKRWQQIAEKLKAQLKEREIELDKLKVHFNSAKATIGRLEREKALLEGRGAVRGSSGGSGTSARFVGSDSNKYTTAESPDSCTTESTGSDDACTELNTFAQNSKEIIEALKSRIESQQRRIIAMELERKGSNTMTHEFEKLQEKISSLEAQNIRLEAKTLQLQLDNDMLRKSDESERMRGQMKHLEDYIQILKDELAKPAPPASIPQTINVECQRCARAATSGGEISDYSSKLEQTVIALRRVVEKLKVENKQLRDGRHGSSGTTASSRDSSKSGSPSKEGYDRLKKDHEKLQQSYTEALNRVAALQVEVELLSSANCPRCSEGEKGRRDEGEQDNELERTLEKKTQLLEKAKILLTRAAAKERYLKEQIALLRRKCSDLQNVPVIDEISE
ncbi:conserved hypothetical protein [Culex quinquefasciatus]|uniref:Uncharacterized protein n=1 Tax=Culex quinquefasciatus TaxID=7176 RepID=B0XB51_CULQU|nr:conserved hypothetical protein [Culex quinquefasciatus]|eukprot:XP_001866873.1 conserved hypothetical protein [Culex quinquefasciatus]